MAKPIKSLQMSPSPQQKKLQRSTAVAAKLPSKSLAAAQASLNVSARLEVGKGYSSTDVQIIAEGRSQPIKSLPIKVSTGGIAAAVQFVANNYGARLEVDKETIKECIRQAQDHFGHFGIPEIVQAYRLWAAGKIEGLEMYGGQFNVTQFSRVLKGYDKYRRDVSVALAAEQDKLMMEAVKAKRRKRYDKETKARHAALPGILQEARETRKYLAAKSIPEIFYLDASAIGLIKFSSNAEKLPYWRKALRVAKAQLRAEYANVRSIRERDALDEQFERRLKTKAELYVKKLLVFERLLHNAEFFDYRSSKGDEWGPADVPVGWYPVAVRNGLIEFGDRAASIWRTAKKQVHDQLDVCTKADAARCRLKVKERYGQLMVISQLLAKDWRIE